MILDEVRSSSQNSYRMKNEVLLQQLMDRESYFRRWVEHPSSVILHHDNSCCEEARLWFLAYARSMESWSLSQYQMKAPNWLSQHFKWGPTRWPIAWCEVVKAKTIDCGVFAALAREIFKAQGFDAHPAQGLIRYNENCTNHWQEMWLKGLKKEEAKQTQKRKGEIFPWIGSEVVYHEFCVVETHDGEALLYDSTWGNWYEDHPRTGFGSLLALKVECPRTLNWNNKTITCGEWIDL